MNKIKLFIASMLGAIALVFASIINVNAMSVTNNNKTATWTTSDMDGMLQLGNSPTTFDSTKSYVAASSFNIKSYITLIPVPSATSTGSLTITANGTKNDRYCYLIDNTTNAANTTLSFVMNGTPSNNFTAANILTYNNAYYIGVTALNGSTRYDFKATQFVVTLTSDDSYVTQVKVSYYLQGGSTAISSNNISSGDTLNPSVTCWGKTITGYYSDSACTTAWDTTAKITSDTSVYCKYTDWTMDSNKLDVDLISKGYDVFGTGTSDKSHRELSGTIYTLLMGNTRFEATSEMTISTEIGKASHAINTGGGFSDTNIKNGLRIQPTKSGTLSMYVYSANDRTLTMYDSSSTEINAGQTTGKSTMTLVTYNLEADETYNFGAGGSFYIYYASFTTPIADSVTLAFDKQFDKDGSAATKLRFIGTIEGLATTEYTKIESITFTFDFNGEDDRALSVTQLYLSITGYDQYAAASNKMYFVYQLDNINKTAYKGLSLTNCKLIVVFTDKSSKEIDHADIELPATFDNYVA